MRSVNSVHRALSLYSTIFLVKQQEISYINFYREVTLEDFKSYYELKKTPKIPRGMKKDVTMDPHYYGVSSFLKKEIVEQKMKFPNPKKKMAVGYVYCEGGPEDTNDQHVCWWLYEGTDVSGFRLIGESNNE